MAGEWQEKGNGLGDISYGLGEPGGDIPGVEGDRGCWHFLTGIIFSIQVQRKAWKHSKQPKQLNPELLTVLKLGKEKTNCITTAKECRKKNMKTWVKLGKAEAREEAQPAEDRTAKPLLPSWAHVHPLWASS